MIRVNGKEVEVKRFPDGTANVKGDVSLQGETVVITWNYEDDAEFVAVSFLTKFYQAHGMNVSLFLPYVPNARMDRIEEPNDIFAMKYFAEMINSLNFDRVFVVDPHSSVVAATIKNCNVINTNIFVSNVLDMLIHDGITPIMFFPDEGAMKRYSKGIKIPYAFGVKRRDWKTGQIFGLDVMGIKPEEIKGKDVLIRDDICSKGGTFYYAAKKLKEMGARNIYLFVSHCEKSIYDGQFGDDKMNLLTVDYEKKSIFGTTQYRKLIDHVFTTDSIYPFKSDENVTVFAMNVDYAENVCDCGCGCHCKEDK